MNMKVLGYEKLVKKFPDCPKEVPFDLLNEEHAQDIHGGQTLKRLNERGGLCPAEIIGNIEKLSFRQIVDLDNGVAIVKLNEYLKAANKETVL